MNCSDMSIYDDTVNVLIATHIDAGGLITTPIDSTDCADTHVLDDTIDRLMMLIY